MCRCLEHLLTIKHRVKVSRKTEVWKFPQLEYKAPRGVCKTDEQAVSAAVLTAQVYSGLDLEKWLNGRRCLLKPSRKDVTPFQGKTHCQVSYLMACHFAN